MIDATLECVLNYLLLFSSCLLTISSLRFFLCSCASRQAHETRAEFARQRSSLGSIQTRMVGVLSKLPSTPSLLVDDRTPFRHSTRYQQHSFHDSQAPSTRCIHHWRSDWYLYILPIALHVSIVHSIQDELILDTIRCSIVKSNLFLSLFIDGVLDNRQILRRNRKLTFGVCITLYQIKAVISPPSFSRPESPNRRHMPAFYERAPVRFEPPYHTPLRLIQGWVFPRVFDWPAMNFCNHARHVPSTCGRFTRIRPIGFDKKSRRRTFTNEGDKVLHATIDGRGKRQEYIWVVLLSGPPHQHTVL